MPVVFVHGVNNRAGPEYDARNALIAQYCDAHLRDLTLAGSTLEHATPVFPYWGGDAAKFYWENASLPSGSFDALGANPVETSLRPVVASLIQQLPASEVTGEPLLSLARRDLVAAVEALSAVLLEPDAPGAPGDKAAFIVAAQRYALDATQPRTPASISNDQQWVQWLEKAVTPRKSGPQGLGVFGNISDALQAGAYMLKNAILGAGRTLADRSGNLVSSLVMAWGRESLNTTLGRFFGDIFVYLNARGEAGSPGEIPTIVIDAIQSARSQQPDEPLVLMGHSLGGVILYDLLSSFIPDVPVAALVTVGSQVGFFEEMKLYRASDIAIVKPRHVARPPGVRHWVNAFDPVDIFSYVCSPIFDGVQDFQYDCKTHTLHAHVAYLEQERFYRRLRARLAESDE